MADDLDTGKQDPAQGTDQNLDDGQKQAPPADQDKGKKDKPFTPEQEQYIGSWMGRIIKKQFEESIVPLIHQQKPVYQSQAGQDDVLKRFNEEVSEELFTNPVNAIQKVLRAVKTAETTLTQNQKTQVEKAITSFSDDPLYKDIYQEMKDISHKAVGDGYPADAAAKFAFAQAKANYFEKKMSGDGGGGGLNLAEGGKRSPSSKSPKLPPEFKKAFERDKAKGLFKTEAEYIESLSPTIRAKYDI